MGEWKVRRGESEWLAGSVAILQECAVSGRLSGSDYIFNPILEKWMYADDVLELRAVIAQGSNTRGSSHEDERQRTTSSQGGFNSKVFGIIILVIGFYLTAIGVLVFVTNGSLTSEEVSALTPSSTSGNYWDRFLQNNIYAPDAVMRENESREIWRHGATIAILIGLVALVIGGAIIVSSKSPSSPNNTLPKPEGSEPR